MGGGNAHDGGGVLERLPRHDVARARAALQHTEQHRNRPLAILGRRDDGVRELSDWQQQRAAHLALLLADAVVSARVDGWDGG